MVSCNVLGLILFNIFISGLERGVYSEISKFMDDTKFILGRFQTDGEDLQKDLTKVGERAKK